MEQMKSNGIIISFINYLRIRVKYDDYEFDVKLQYELFMPILLIAHSIA